MAQSNTQTVYQIQSQQLPAWYETYLQNIAGRAEGLADQPYAQYTGQRIAELTPDQQAAFAAVRGGPGYQQYVDQGTRLAENAMGINFGQSLAAGDQYLGTGGHLLQQAAARDTAGLYDPYATEASGLLRTAAEREALGYAQPYVQQAVNYNGLAAASPYLGAASRTFPGAAQEYMSPYTSLVTDRIAELGARNLQERLLPSISDDFIRAGQYGSTAQRDTIGRALRDTQEAVLGEQARSLESGYRTAGELFSSDAARMAGLAGTAGNLGLGQANVSLQAGRTLSDVASQDLARKLAAGQEISGIGQFTSSAAAADAARQLQAGQTLGQLGIQRGQLGLNAAQAGAENLLAGSRQFGVLGQQQQDQNLRQAAALENIGQTQQQQLQRNLDLGYSDFMQQRDYPWQQLGNMSNIIRGQQIGGTTTGQTQTQGGGPSTLQQIGGIGLGVAGLAGSGLFRAKGGKVKKPKPKAFSTYGSLPKRGIGFMAEAA